MRVSVVIVAPGTDYGQKGIDGVQEVCGRAGPASMVAELEHVEFGNRGK
jgi:hypothetical protein